MRLPAPLRRFMAVLAGAAALTAGTPALAQSIRAAVGLDNWTFGGTAAVVVPGMTTRAFPNPAGGRFIVTFSAECALSLPTGSNSTSAWIDVDIVVLDATGTRVVATLPPTAGNLDSFCGSNGIVGFQGWATHSVTAVGGDRLPAGNYRIQVRSRINAAPVGTSGWLGERTLNVSR